jgi:histidinol-phosphate aminotransferase
VSGLPVRLRSDLDALPQYRLGKRQDPADAARRLRRMAAVASNEMPYGPLPSVAAAVAGAHAGLNRYPDPFALGLRTALADTLGTSVEQVAAGPGSIGLCQLALTVAAEPGSEIVFPWPSFEGYPLLAAIAGATAAPVPLERDAIDPDRFVAAVTNRTRALFICNPNNPTGTILTREQIDALVCRLPGDRLIVIDEAYAEFTPPDTHSFALVAEHSNLLVTRTFSKAYGLAGLRVGYAMGAPALISALQRAQLPFAINSLSIAGAQAALAAADELADRVGAILAQRRVVEDAARATGFPVGTSHGNFIWLAVGSEATSLALRLEHNGVLARPIEPYGVRITVGDEHDTALVVTALKRAAV